MSTLILNTHHITKISESTSVSDIMVAISTQNTNTLNYLKGIFDCILSNDNDSQLEAKKNLLNSYLIDAKRTTNLDD